MVNLGLIGVGRGNVPAEDLVSKVVQTKDSCVSAQPWGNLMLSGIFVESLDAFAFQQALVKLCRLDIGSGIQFCSQGSQANLVPVHSAAAVPQPAMAAH